MLAGLNKTINFTYTAIADNIRWTANKTFVGPDLRSGGFDDSSPQITLNLTQNPGLGASSQASSPGSVV